MWNNLLAQLTGQAPTLPAYVGVRTFQGFTKGEIVTTQGVKVEAEEEEIEE